MPISIRCPCSATLRVGENLRGSQIQCQRCQAVHDVTGKSARASAPPPDADVILDAAGFLLAESNRLEDELEHGENVLWAGKSATRAAYLDGLHHCVGPLFLAAIASANLILGRNEFPWYVLVIIAVLDLLFLSLAVAGPIYHGVRYSGARYALTDRRALTWSRDWLLRKRLNTYEPEDIAHYSRSRAFLAKGVESLVFANRVEIRLGPKKIKRKVGFLFIVGAEAVERKMREYLLDPYIDRLTN